MRFKYTLESYKGTKRRFDCPNCNAKREFVRYLDCETNEPLAAHVGRCNRASSCGYHFTPREFFADNPTSKSDLKSLRAKKSDGAKRSNLLATGKQNAIASMFAAKRPDYIGFDVLRRSLTNYENNAFVQFLLSQIEADEVLEVLRRYFVGTSRNGRCVFWQIDRAKRVRTGKLIAYDAETGKRCKDKKPSFVHAELKRANKLKDDFQLKQCYFGEHLLSEAEPSQAVGIVESEKTAVIASLFLPQFIWLACGSKATLTGTRLAHFKPRRIVLYPDADGFKEWTARATDARREFDLQIEVSDFIEFAATEDEKRGGYDLADYLLITKRRELEQINARINQVMQSSELFAELNTILDERAAILEIDHNLSEREAEAIVTEQDALRRLAVELATN